MKITWLGHAAFRIEIKGAVILIDPFITGNDTCPVSVDEAAKDVTHILLSHGHSDHVGDTLAIAKKTKAQVIGNYELCCWLESKGAKNTFGLNPGGGYNFGPFRATLTIAHHSSSAEEDKGPPVYLGNPCGIVLEAKGEPTLYHAGDTEIFSDMALINEFYQPEIGMLPIGDVYTMGGRKAAEAAKRFFDFATVIPIHYATFPVLDKTPSIFIKEMAGSKTKVWAPKPGESAEIPAQTVTKGAA
jgi:L-ascorbate metabolism protein UlaG (beta-lactamase superfamily)